MITTKNKSTTKMSFIYRAVVSLICPSLVVLAGYYDYSIDYPSNNSTKVVRYTDEQRLVAKLFATYSSDLRPIVNDDRPIIVQIGLNLIQIFDLDEKNQVLVANCWIDEEWNDEYIRWNPDDYGGMYVIRIPSNLLWQPDIVLYNNADEYKASKVITRAMVGFDGNVFLPLPTKVSSSCKFDVTFFPFDEQICSLKYGSWTYNGWKIDIVNRTGAVDMSNYIENGEWDVIGAYQQKHLVFYSCCVEPYSDVTFYVHLRRKPLYYAMNVFVPSSAMSAMTLLVFLLPSDSNQKVNLGITTLLSYSVFTLSVVQKLPETSENAPLITLYLASVLSSTSMSVLNTVFILAIHHRPIWRLKPVPDLVKKIFFHKVASAICIRHPTDFSAPLSLMKMAENLKSVLLVQPNPMTTTTTSSRSRSTTKSSTSNLFINSNRRASLATEMFLRHKEEQAKREKVIANKMAQLPEDSLPMSRTPSDDGDSSSDVDRIERKVSVFTSTHSANFIAKDCSRIANQWPPPFGDESNEAGHRAELKKVVSSLSKVAKRYEKQHKNEQVVLEWQHLALIFDRFLFVVYMSVTLAVVVFLAFGPRNLQPDLTPDISEGGETTATGV